MTDWRCIVDGGLLLIKLYFSKLWIVLAATCLFAPLRPAEP